MQTLSRAMAVLATAALSGAAASAESWPQLRSRAAGGAGVAYVPYLDMTLNADPGLPHALDATGARVLALGFVTARGKRCDPAWGGTEPLRNATFLREVRAVRARHGDVRVSFGGQNGAGTTTTDLSLACGSPSALARAYETAVSVYNARQVDFDVEGDAVASRTATTRTARAIALLERWASAHRRRLRVSLTIPVAPTGLDATGLSAVRATDAAGARIDVVNVMAMDYGDNVAPPGAKTMAAYAIDALSATKRQLGETRWSRLGVTAMIGVNDIASEVFSLADARTLAAFVRAHGLGQISIWSAARDRACGSRRTTAQADCSGVAQQPGGFSQIFAR
jgi:hypothetical protein